MKFIISLFLFSTLLLSNEHTIKIGVLAKRGAEVAFKKWNPTAQYLSEHIKSNKFKIIPLSFSDIFKAVENKEIDFILANSGFYVELEYQYGAQRICTLVNKHISGLTQTKFGGVLITHIDNKDKYNTIDDLVDTNFAAVNVKSLGGWQMAWRELVEHGLDIESDLKSLVFKGTHDKVVYSVLNKESDIGTIRTDTIERMAIEGKIDLNLFHFVAIKKYDDFPYVISTKLYPEWPIAKLKHTSDKLSKKVAIALMNMKSESSAAKSAKIFSWNTPLSYQPVHECFKILKIPPYFQKIDFIDVVNKYWHWILFYIFLAISGISMLFHQIRLTQNLKNTQEELIQTEKMASLGRLVAGVAHEINTPIGVGVTAASHLQKETNNFNKKYLNEDITQSTFEKYVSTSLKSSAIILDNLSRASDLIKSFKQISVDQSSDVIRDFNLKKYMQSIIDSLKPTMKHTDYKVELICDENINIVSNPGVYSQIFSNLIMNTIIHGFEGKKEGTITIKISREAKDLHIIYMDDGKGMSKEDLSKVFDPFFTTKRGSGGSGLGANIIYNLVTQKLYGTIQAESEPNIGLKFTMNFKGVKYV